MSAAPVATTSIPHFIASRIVATSSRPAPLVVDLAAAISEVTVRTQIQGASFMTVAVIDPDWSIATTGFLDVTDGLLDPIEVNFPEGSDSWWRLCAVDITLDTSGPNLTLTFEDRIVAYLRAHWGPKTAKPGTTTRAQFIKQLVDEVGISGSVPKIKFVCPSLNVVQPIQLDTSSVSVTTTVQTPAGQATTTTKVNKKRGVHPQAAITIKSKKPSQNQLTEIQALLSEAEKLKAGPLATLALICAGIGESDLGDAAGTYQPNKSGYWGVLQCGSGQNGSANSGIGARDTVQMAHYFLVGGKGFQGGGAMALARTTTVPLGQAHDPTHAAAATTDPGQIATLVEASGEAADFYGKWATEAQAIIDAYGGVAAGSQGGTGNLVSDVGQLARGSVDNPDEDSWDCITRLAQQVTWFVFSNADTLYYMDGPDLIGQKAVMIIDPLRDRDMLPAFSATFDNTAYIYQSVHKVRGKIQKKSRVAKPTTPAEVRFSLFCDIDGDDVPKAGDVIIFHNAGPINGRWIVADATRRCLADTFTQYTLAPPIAPTPEPQATPDTAKTTPNPGTAPQVDRGTGIHGYGRLIDSGATFAGLDQGIDFTGKADVYALDDGIVTRLERSGSGWPGEGALLVYRLTAGDYKDRWVYTSEDFAIVNILQVGTVISRGQVIGTATGSGRAPGIETGFAQNAHGSAYGSTSDGKGGNAPNSQAVLFQKYVQTAVTSVVTTPLGQAHDPTRGR